MVKLSQLKPGHLVICLDCGESYSADPWDYFVEEFPDTELDCECGSDNLVLAEL